MSDKKYSQRFELFLLKPAIIVPAFSRANSLYRLLTSIAECDLKQDAPTIIISLDGGCNAEVVDVARRFASFFPGTEIVSREDNLGVRDHVLWCGDLTKQYGSVIVLEDDLLVDPYFYIFASRALAFYTNEDRIGGISLFSQKNVGGKGLPFDPMFNGTSGYFMQLTCSWGQAWTYDQWWKFKAWYAENSVKGIGTLEGVPPIVREWPDTSWKKFHIAYLVYTNRFFFYPYVSYTTNCSDAGGFHKKTVGDTAQVPLPLRPRGREHLSFPKFEENSVRYDAYSEPCPDYLEATTGVRLAECEVDTYGAKPKELLQTRKYCLTSRAIDAPIQQFPLRFKPVEQNIYLKGEQSSQGTLNFGLSSNVIYSQPSETRVRLLEYYTGISQQPPSVIKRIFYKYYIKRHSKRLLYWCYRKVRYPYKMLRNIVWS